MEKTTKQKSIEHHERLLAFAETRPKENRPNALFMELSIGKNWMGLYCSYCSKYLYNTEYYCPLYAESEDENENPERCCNGLWHAMAFSKTWEEWIMWEKRAIEYIRQNG